MMVSTWVLPLARLLPAPEKVPPESGTFSSPCFGRPCGCAAGIAARRSGVHVGGWMRSSIRPQDALGVIGLPRLYEFRNVVDLTHWKIRFATAKRVLRLARPQTPLDLSRIVDPLLLCVLPGPVANATVLPPTLLI
jgi:hypothetical protein